MCAKKVTVERKGTAVPLGPRAPEPPPRTEVHDDGLMDDEIAARIMRSKMTWREWLLYDFLRYWYGIGALAVLTFSVTYVSWRYHVRDPLGLAALAAGGMVLVALEFLLYRQIWPEGVFTKGWPIGRRIRILFRRIRWRL